MLSAENGAAFDHAYIKSQLDYQVANDALYLWKLQNGSNTELKAFTKHVLPTIDDHKQKISSLSASVH